MTRMRTTIVAAAAVAGFSLQASAATEWLMASGYPESNFHTKNIRMFIDDVAEATGGELEIVLHSNDTLIKLDEIRRAVQRGQIPIGEIRLGVYGNEDPMYILDSLPFVAPDYESARQLLEAQKPYFEDKFAEQGLRVLYYAPWPGQGFYTKFEVTSTDDFEGKRLRIYSTATRQMGEMLGFDATILPFAEIPQAFATGLIDALFTSAQTGIDIQAWDNTDHFTYAGAMFTKNAVVVNETAFNALDPAQQEALLEAAAVAEDRGFTMSRETNEEQIGILAEHGMKVSEAPQQVVDAMTEIGKQMMEEWRAEASPEAEAVLDAYVASR